jgi:hypothetical protein
LHGAQALLNLDRVEARDSEPSGVVLKAFREAIAHRCGLTSAEVTQFLQQRFDIVHIGTYVCPRTGDLVFSDIDTRTGACLGPDVDYLTPDALAMLLKGSQTRLVIVTSCDSLALVPTLLTVTNVVATRDLVSAKMMAKWVEAFHGWLPMHSLKESFEYAVAQSRAPMKLYLQENSADLHFQSRGSAVKAAA